LHEHREDVPDLANRLLLRSIEAKQVPPRRFSTAALNALRNYNWPGNLSQLENVVHTVAITAQAEEISPHEVNQALAQFSTRSSAPLGLPLDLPLREARDAFERVYFEHHIVKEGGNMSRVAESVGLERTHLYRKLKQLGVKLNRRSE
jgi:DNA-binding NtrC family response regulator